MDNRGNVSSSKLALKIGKGHLAFKNIDVQCANTAVRQTKNAIEEKTYKVIITVMSDCSIAFPDLLTLKVQALLDLGMQHAETVLFSGCSAGGRGDCQRILRLMLAKCESGIEPYIGACVVRSLASQISEISRLCFLMAVIMFVIIDLGSLRDYYIP